jgi:hypothetical protein
MALIIPSRIQLSSVQRAQIRALFMQIAQSERELYLGRAFPDVLELKGIDVSGSASVFADRLIEKLVAYGKINQTEYALKRMLDTLDVGTDVRDHIERLWSDIMGVPLPHEPVEPPASSKPSHWRLMVGLFILIGIITVLLSLDQPIFSLAPESSPTDTSLQTSSPTTAAFTTLTPSDTTPTVATVQMQSVATFEIVTPWVTTATLHPTATSEIVSSSFSGQGQTSYPTTDPSGIFDDIPSDLPADPPNTYPTTDPGGISDINPIGNVPTAYPTTNPNGIPD